MNKQNWEISYEHHLKKYSELDPSEASARSGLDFDFEQSRFTLSFLNHKLYAEWPKFKLIPADNAGCPKALYDFMMQVLAMRVLYTGISVPAGDGFKAYREFPWGELYDINFTGRCIKRFAYGFGYKPDAFIKAAETLGGVKLDLGDASFDFTFLGGVVSRYILWKPDEEFPPSAQILFSDNAQFMYNAEDLAAVGDVIIGALKECAAK